MKNIIDHLLIIPRPSHAHPFGDHFLAAGTHLGLTERNIRFLHRFCVHPFSYDLSMAEAQNNEVRRFFFGNLDNDGDNIPSLYNTIYQTFVSFRFQ